MKRLITICLCVLFASTVALGDWDPGDDYKMHWPQLPDPFGWDVLASATYPDYTQKVLADDWLCTETGPVEDIHLWGSWKNDYEVPIMGIYVSIHDNIEADPLDPNSYSMPGDLLWGREFMDGEFTVRDYGFGDQGWFNPNTGEYTLSDHSLFHQINIEHIENPFEQQKDEIYWLDITVFIDDDPMMYQWGWKTSLDHFEDDAVWIDATEPLDYGAAWNELIDPYGESLDLAFVITPEPATLVLLGLGSLALLRRKRKV